MGIYLLYIIPFVFLQTVFGAAEIEFSVKENPYRYLEGDAISNMCSLSEPVDNAELRWYNKDNQLITNTDESVTPYVKKIQSKLLLKVGHASSENAGSYKCEAIINEIKLEKDFHVQVKERIKFRDCPSRQIGILNQESKIKCTAYGAQLDVVAFWVLKGVDLTLDDNIVQGDTVLTLKKTKQTDEGKYFYNAISNNDGQSDEREIEFVVYSAPEIIEPVSQTATEAAVGQPAVMFCKAKGIPDPIIEWTKEGSSNALITGDRIKISSNLEGGQVQGILNITSVIKEDEATYTCTAKNEASNENLVAQAERTAQLTVHIPPTIESANNRSGKENGPGKLVCTARGDPIPKMIWINERTGERYTTGSSNGDISAIQTDDNTPGNIGATLTLSFDSLKHSDAGLYKCEAINKAATVSKIVSLEVEYKPNFNDQGPTTFYNWDKNENPYIVCTANGNPLPSFRWKKGDQEIQSTDPYYEIIPPVKDAENKHRIVSKLKVDISSAKDKDALFGEYTCIATNLHGPSEITLLMDKAEIPGQPIVDMHRDDASLIEFWLEGPKVKGPDVTRYRVSYKIKGSNTNSTVMEVEKEYRDYIDTSRKYTILRVEGLIPNTQYVFDFYAINPVGTGPARTVEKTTKKIREPETPGLDDTPMNSGKPTEILVKWTIPSNGGSAIREYILSYQRVSVKPNTSENSPYQVEKKLGKPVTRAGIKDPTFLIKDLIPGTYYLVEVSAVNRKGAGFPAKKVIRTQIDPNYDPSSIGGTGPRWEPVHVSMTMLGCLITLHACLKCLM